MKHFISILIGIFFATSTLLAQDANFARRLETAQRQYANGKYQEALSTIRVAMDRYLPDDAQKKEAEALRQKCQAQLGRFQVTEDSKTLSWQAGVDSIAVVTGNSKGVSVSTDSPTWCNVEFQDNQIRLYVTENSTHDERRALVTASLGRNKKTIVVTQEAKPVVNKWVMISTSPSGANVTIDDTFVSSVPVFNKLLGGRKHRFVLEKNSYQKKDTTIFIPDTNIDDTLRIVVPLTPDFTKIKLTLANPENCEIDDPFLQIRVNDHLLAWNSDLDNSKKYTYDDTKKVSLYHVYNDGTVPVEPGVSQVSFKAEGFHDLELLTPNLEAGEKYHISLKPRPYVGKLRVVRLEDAYYAEAKGSNIILDGKYDLGMLKDTLVADIKIGHHTLEARKKGFLPDKVQVDIEEDNPFEFNPVLFPYVNYSFSSTPEDAAVYVDGIKLQESTPVIYKRGASSGVSSFEVLVEKPGYAPARHAFLPDFSVPDMTFNYDFLLQPSQQIRVKTKWGSKKKDYFVTVTGKPVGGEYPADSIFIKRERLPAQVSLTPRSTPYRVSVTEMAGDSQREVFSHSFIYKGQAKDSIKTAALLIPMWNVKFIKANYYYIPKRQYFTLGENPSNEYSPLGSIGIGDIQTFIGLSSSVVRSSVFLERNMNRELGINGKILSEHLPMIPAFSVLFLNWDYRFGGIVANAFKTNVLTSFAYYPSFSQVLAMDTISGFELFAGIELSSLIPVFNVNIRAGYQMYRGMKASVYMDKKGNDPIVTRDFTIPDMFVISLGFSLGTGRGEHALSLFKPF